MGGGGGRRGVLWCLTPVSTKLQLYRGGQSVIMVEETGVPADPGFQVRGGALKKIAPSEGRRENFWGISCEKSRFYAKKSYFFPIAEGGAKMFGVFRVKNHDFAPKSHIFSNFRGGGGARAGCASPWIRPCVENHRPAASK